MARRSNPRTRKPIERRRPSWWWLALPLLGVAAYAAFDATLGLLTPDQAGQVPAPQAADGGAAGDLAPASPAAPAAPPSDAPLAAVADPVLGIAVATEPVATPTAADRRAAAGTAAAKASPKRAAKAPKEHLTDGDRRALDRVIEGATD